MAVKSQQDEMLADSRREFKTMPGKSGSYDDIRPLGMTVENEMTIRGPGVETYHALDDL